MKCLVLSLVFFSVGRSKGNKQEAEMMKTEEESTLQVTFSTHLFASPRKASELCTHFDSETTVFVNTPAEKVYSFGHQCLESIIDWFFTQNPLPKSGAIWGFEVGRSAIIFVSSIYSSNRSFTG